MWIFIVCCVLFLRWFFVCGWVAQRRGGVLKHDFVSLMCFFCRNVWWCCRSSFSKLLQKATGDNIHAWFYNYAQCSKQRHFLHFIDIFFSYHNLLYVFDLSKTNTFGIIFCFRGINIKSIQSITNEYYERLSNIYILLCV